MLTLRILIVLLVCLSAGCLSARQNAPVESAESRPVTAARDAEILDKTGRDLRAKGLEDLHLEVNNGDVKVWGRVSTKEQKVLAEQTVKDTPGVTRVDSWIIVGEERLLSKPAAGMKPPTESRRPSNVNINKPGGPRKLGVP